MVTLLAGMITADQIQQIIGIILAILEGLLILTKFLQYIVPVESRFGQFLSRLFKGLTFLKDKTHETIESENVEDDENK